MKRLILGLVILALLGAVAWGVGAMATQTTSERWLQARADEGWVANSAEISVSGFPTRFVTEFQTLELADPDTGLAWSAPWLRLEQDVLRLDRIRATFSETQILASPTQRLTLESQAMEATLDVQPANRFALDALGADLAPLEITSNAGWRMQMGAASVAIARQEGTAYDFLVLATDMTPPEAWRTRLDPAGLLPAIIAHAELRGEATFDTQWDLSAIETRRPQPTRLELEEVRADWGDVLLRASGTLDIGPDGLPEGDLAIRAENWEVMLELAVNAGILSPQLRPAAQSMLGALAGLSGRPENIDATLSFAGGRVFVGPLPLGPAPRLSLR